MSPQPSPVEIGVGVDVARYQHVVQFLDADRRPLRKQLVVDENREGYDRLAKAFDDLARKHPAPLFRCVIDDAGVYGRNLRSFLQTLPHNLTITTANPLTNRYYKKTFLQDNKNDGLDARYVARYAVAERPAASPALDPAVELLKTLCSRLRSQRRQTRRLVNQMHLLLALSFPEFAGLFKNIASDTARALLRKYPTAQKAARASVGRLARFQAKRGARSLGPRKAKAFARAAKSSVASLKGPAAERMLLDLLDQFELSRKAEEHLTDAVKAVYKESLPNHLLSIPGVGPYSAGVYTAFIGDIRRFPSPDHLVGYFGVYPVEDQSGRRRGHRVMSSKGNDLVRQALFMNCLCGIQKNPVLKELYERKCAEGKSSMVAIGHCMRKLLHIIDAVLRKNEPFDPRVGRRADDASNASDAAAESAESHSSKEQTEAPLREASAQASNPIDELDNGPAPSSKEKPSGPQSALRAADDGQRSPEGLTAHDTPSIGRTQSRSVKKRNRQKSASKTKNRNLSKKPISRF